MYQLKSKVITYFDGKTIDLHSVIAPFAPETDRKAYTPENFIMQKTANYHYDLLENYARQYLEKENGL